MRQIIIGHDKKRPQRSWWLKNHHMNFFIKSSKYFDCITGQIRKKKTNYKSKKLKTNQKQLIDDG